MDINVTRDSKLVKVLAAQARRERVDSDVVAEANDIIMTLAQDLNPQNRHQIAQTVAYTVDELQQHQLDFLNTVADIKNIGYGDKAAFNVKEGHVKAYIQAKGSTTARSMVGGKQILVDTKEISARPAINLMEMRTGRVNMADLIREANTQMTNMKLGEIERVLTAGISQYQSPFYATGTGIVKTDLDAMINHFRRLGPVSIVGDIAAASQVMPLAGAAMNTTITQFSDAQITEMNQKGYLGQYNGASVLVMPNAYKVGTIDPILRTDALYVIPGGMTGDARNLKVVNEGSVQSIDSQNIDDLVYEIRLDQWFGAALCVGEFPTIGMYDIN